MDNEPTTLIAVLRRSHERLASLADGLKGDQLTGPSYCSDWTIAQVFSHLGSGAEISRLTLEAEVSGTPADHGAMPPIWDRWNAKSPEEQVADCLPADDTHITALEELTADELAAIDYDFFGRVRLDAAGLVRMRLSEHAVHTWDVAVALDPAAEVAPDAVEQLMAHLPMVTDWAGRAAGEPFRVRLRGTSPEAEFVLDVAEKASLSPWPGDGPADAAAQGQIQLPAEALLRLVYGRLDPAHTPPVQISGDPGLLDRVRAVFPGF